MRVIAGTFKGRRLQTPDWDGLRPTSDKLRETLFNVLAPRIGEARVLDGFAGTGAVGVEALSRGAAQVTFVEADARAVRLIAAQPPRTAASRIAMLLSAPDLRTRYAGAPQGRSTWFFSIRHIRRTAWRRSLDAAAPLVAPDGLRGARARAAGCRAGGGRLHRENARHPLRRQRADAVPGIAADERT